MVALFVGLVLIFFAVYAVLPVPWSLQWWQDVLAFLRGGVPIMALFVGLVAFFIGVADIKDKVESRREEEQEKKEASEAQKSAPDK
jgi:hypothetical protein